MGVKEFATYDIDKDYYENFENGPKFSGNFPNLGSLKKESFDFFGKSIDFPLGIPAGLLLNSRWIDFYSKMGFSLLVYKTVRTRKHPSHPHPNCLFVKSEMLDPFNLPYQLVAPVGYEPSSVREVTITNSFGMPSMDPDWWQEDMEKATIAVREGCAVLGSGVGTYQGTRWELIRDFVTVASMIKETGVSAVILNLSCPNVGDGEGLIYTDSELSKDILREVKKAIRDMPLIVKVGFMFGKPLYEFVRSVAKYVEGISGINSIQTRVVTEEGLPALGKGREKSGVCGWAIRECAKLFTKELYSIRQKLKAEFLIMSCGGVTDSNSFYDLIESGADVVLSCTGAMFNPFLALEIRK